MCHSTDGQRSSTHNSAKNYHTQAFGFCSRCVFDDTVTRTIYTTEWVLRIYRTIKWHIVLYGCQTWSLKLREERRLRVFENRLLRRIFGPKRDEMTGEWRKLHNEELNDLYSSPNKVQAIEYLTLRRLMSYIYGAPILDVSRSHTTTQHSR